MGTAFWSWYIPWRSLKHQPQKDKSHSSGGMATRPQGLGRGDKERGFPAAFLEMESILAWSTSRSRGEEEQAVGSQPSREKRNMAPVPSGRDLFCIPQWRRLPLARLCSLPQLPLQGMEMRVWGVKGDPQIGKRCPGRACRGKRPKEKVFSCLSHHSHCLTLSRTGIPVASREDAGHNFLSYPLPSRHKLTSKYHRNVQSMCS